MKVFLLSLLWPIVFCFDVVCFSQETTTMHYQYYDNSSMEPASDSIPLSFSFFTSTCHIFRDELAVYFISDNDTILKKSDFSGEGNFKLKPGRYDILICSELIQPLTIPAIHFEKYRAYFFEVYLYPRTIRLPEIRYDLGKPVIYFYTDQARKNLELKIETSGKFMFTYPEYSGSWKFDLDSGGTIRMDENSYPYLFWDARFENTADYFASGTGFTVPSENLTDFLDSALTEMGFGFAEKADFITYWGPQMAQYESTDIHFLFQEKCASLASLQITPQPENMYRVYMIWRPSAGQVKLIPQEIPEFHPSRFSLLEWGGMQVIQKPDQPE